ncbi:MAG: CYTH domain-containing protein [Lachnospiraceae bacterium]|nr:CYTH domain-containing protein [Lachnospiraceae bacterium]
MEIERKFLVPELPADLDRYPFHEIEQAYLCRGPVVRVRRQDDDYILTYKGSGKMIREEYNLPLTKESYEHLAAKADGNRICKRRYCIPLAPYTVELDVFREPFGDMVLAEVEFPTEEEALAFEPPAWLGEDVTQDDRFHNSRMSQTVYQNHSFWNEATVIRS